MTKFINMSIIAITAIFMTSCETVPENETLWVSGIQIECDAGAGKAMCLQVSDDADLEDVEWESFYNDIEGFKFEEGKIQKISVKKEDVENAPADASSIKYTLVEVLETMYDKRMAVDGSWILAQAEGNPIDRSKVLPTLVIDLKGNKISGNGGCNNFNGEIDELTQSKMEFGDNISRTLRACANENMEDKFFTLLNEVETYKIEGDMLVLSDESNKSLLSFIKNNVKLAPQQLHDIWNASSVMGIETDKSSEVPRLEINLTEMKIMGTDGCNNFNAPIDNIDSKNMKLGNIASTKKMCKDMAIPDAFNKAMAQVASYQLDGLNLKLIDQEGNVLITFLKGD